MKSELCIQTGNPCWDHFYRHIRSFLVQDSLDVLIDGANIRGYRSPDSKSIWIRDYSDMIRGFRYFEKDLTSVITHFAETQAANGRIFDYFTTFPEKTPCEMENWTKYVRVPVEADVEYRFVKAAFLAWQATGNDAWIQGLFPAMERALNHALSHPWRWDPGVGLVKRPYTIDTWDFAYSSGRHPWLQFQIDEHTHWGIMHGDNSGYYESMRLLAALFKRFKFKSKAALWDKRAETLKTNLNRICWNGRFYTHFVKRTPVTIQGVEESEQLSLSNPMAINRQATDHDMAVSILQEYRRRRRKEFFAEWFSMDPPFPGGIFGDPKLVPGAYVNGGIMPLVGGELARAALEHGMESYGLEILRQYNRLVTESGASYLWYFPNGTPSSIETSTSPDATPTDGWGSSAMLTAFVEGLVGITDMGRCFDHIRLAPRWQAAGINDASISVEYACSGSSVNYQFHIQAENLSLQLTVPDSVVQFHIPLPGKSVKEVRINGRKIPFSISKIENSLYADFRGNHLREATVSIQSA